MIYFLFLCCLFFSHMLFLFYSVSFILEVDYMLKIIYDSVSGCLEQLFGVLTFCFVLAFHPEFLYDWYLDPWYAFKFLLIVFIVLLFCSCLLKRHIAQKDSDQSDGSAAGQ